MINNKVESIKEHIEAIMDILEIERTPSNKNTPLRIAKMWCNELFANRNDQNIEDLKDTMTLFPNIYDDTEMVVVKGIDFNSICEHHWLPFSGKVTIGYVPNKQIVGLSKIPRVVKYFSKRPQLQEQLTQQIGDFLFETLQPKALYVEVEATHQCVKCRGAESDCSTRTYYRKHDLNYLGKEPNWYEEFKCRMRGAL